MDLFAEKSYAGFWSRMAAALLDILLFAPLGYITGCVMVFMIELSAPVAVVFFPLLVLWYTVYLPKRYGGTPGKLIMGIKIVKSDFLPVGWKEVFLRKSVDILFGVLGVILMGVSDRYQRYDVVTGVLLEEADYLHKREQFDMLFIGALILAAVWMISEWAALLTNTRKRAIHDYIAGTVVIKSKRAKKTRENESNGSSLSNESRVYESRIY
jgi:uncharacterized RDD family membrane protein YckC